MQTPKDTNNERETNRYKFLLAFDIDVDKSFFSCRVHKILYQQHLIFLSFMNKYLHTHFAEV